MAPRNERPTDQDHILGNRLELVRRKQNTQMRNLLQNPAQSRHEAENGANLTQILAQIMREEAFCGSR